MAGNTFQKFGDSMSRAITKINIKTSSSLEKSKIKMHIESITKDVQKMQADVGEDVYNLWLQGEFSNQRLTEKLEEVKRKKNEIEQLTIDLAAIDVRDNEIFGTKLDAVQATSINGNKHQCSVCGSEFEATAKFCRKCGNKLQ